MVHSDLPLQTHNAKHANKIKQDRTKNNAGLLKNAERYLLFLGQSARFCWLQWISGALGQKGTQPRRLKEKQYC